MNPLLATILGYLAVFIMALVVAQLLTKGLFSKYLFTKIGKRKGKVLLLIRTPIFDYEKIGILREGVLRYKDRDKTQRLIIVPEDAPFNWLGIVVVQLDETKNAVMKRDYSAVTGYDANKMDDLMLRALNRSRLNDFKQKLMILLVVVCIIALLSIVQVVLLNNLKKTMITMLSSIDAKLLAQNVTQAVGQVVEGVALG